MIRLGFVSPTTGVLSAMGETDAFIAYWVQRHVYDGVTLPNGDKLALNIVSKDSQSSPARAAAVARELIEKDKVDLMLVSSTPDTTNPVCDVCEQMEFPCLSTMAPWQPWFFGRKGDPAKGFQWTYHVFWGLDEIVGAYLPGWKTIPTNKRVGGLFPADADGNAWGDPELGLPKPLRQAGFELVDPGRFAPGTKDFAPQLAAFQKAGVEIVTGVVLPPDAKTFLAQARQAGFKPKIVTLAKALLYPANVDALGGDLGYGLSTEVWWSPAHPFKSSLTGQTPKELAKKWEEAKKLQWSQPLGFVHMLFEVAIDVVKRTGGDMTRGRVRDALAQTNLETIVGPVRWGGAGALKNVCKTPVVLGQWIAGGGSRKHELVIVDNAGAPHIPVSAKLKALGE